jgi:hypothetical protein
MRLAALSLSSGGSGQRPGDRPPFLKSPPNSVLGYSGGFLPFPGRTEMSIEANAVIASHVSGLLFGSRPPAIIFSIGSVDINAIQCFAIGARTHIPKERPEVVAPLTRHGYSPAAIRGKFVVGGVITASLRSGPRPICVCAGQSVRASSISNGITGNTPTASSGSLELTGTRVHDGTAIAVAHPLGTWLSGPTNTLNGHNLTESLPNQIECLHVASITPNKHDCYCQDGGVKCLLG